jgi:hypothetical protein
VRCSSPHSAASRICPISTGVSASNQPIACSGLAITSAVTPGEGLRSLSGSSSFRWLLAEIAVNT